MAIIYTYPVKETPANSDLILISDSADKNKTKQVKISSLPGGAASGVASVTAFTTSDLGIKVSPTAGAVKVGIDILALTDLNTSAAGEDFLFAVDDPSGTPINKKVTIDKLFGTAGLITNSSINYNVKLPNTVGTANQILKLPSPIGTSPHQLEWADDTGGSGTTGSWTPVMFGSVGETATTSGTYVKNGRKVTAWFYINCTTGGSSANKPSIVSGLPVNAVAVNGSRGSGIISNNTAVNASHNFIGAKSNGATTFVLTVFTSSSNYQTTTSTWPSSSGDTFTVEGQFEYYSVA